MTVTPPTVGHPTGQVYDAATHYADNLAAGQAAATDQIIAAWADTQTQARIELDEVLAKIEQARAVGSPVSPAWLYQETRLRSALKTTEQQVARFTSQAAGTITTAQATAVSKAAADSAQLVRTAVAEQAPALAATFVELNEANMRAVVGFLADGSPLRDLLASTPYTTADSIARALTVGVTLGKGIPWMRAQVNLALEVPAWRAVRILRTESHRAYRHVARTTYQANSHLLEGWTWHAHLDARTCSCCVVMHGTMHTVDETLDGHPNCRCAMVPRTKGWGDIDPALADLPDTRPPLPDGKAWLTGQPSSVQRAVLGNRRWAAWKSGKVTLDDMVARTFNPTWGTMRRERTLTEILAGKNPNWDGQPLTFPGSKTPPVVYTPNRAAAVAMANRMSTADLDDLARTATGQVQADAKAALALRLNRLDYTARLPAPDPVKVQAGLAKLEAAAKTKGYPSKGYSQTLAVYKAQANGKVGSKVGVVKSLDWQTKITAQRIITDHDEWMQDWVVKQAAAKAEASATIASLRAEAGTFVSYSDYQDWKIIAQSTVGDLKSPDAVPLVQAWLDSYNAGFHDAVQVAVDGKKQAKKWTNVDNPSQSMLLQDGDYAGWSAVGDGTHAEVWDPFHTARALTSGKWQPVLEPDPKAVAEYVKNAVNPDTGNYGIGYVANLQKMYLDDPTAPVQDKVNVAEAIAQIKATHKPSVPQHYVDVQFNKYVNGEVSKETLTDWANGLDPDVSPMNAAAAQMALEKIAQSEAMEAAATAWVAQEAAKKAAKEAAQRAAAKAAKEEAEKAAKAAAATKQAAAKTDGPPVGSVFPHDVDSLRPTGQVLGTHGARVYDAPDGSRWLFKAPKTATDDFLATLDEAGSRLQARTGLPSPDTYVVTVAGQRGSIQRMYPGARDAFDSGFVPSRLSDSDLLAVQREHVLDWLLSNHDGHSGQFLRTPDGRLVGIDKGQAFRWMGQDRLDWDFHPNAVYGTEPPVYNRLWRAFAEGDDVEVFDPTTGPLADYLATVQAIPDRELRELLRPYAEQAAARGRLAVPQTQPGLVKAAIRPNDVEAFLDAVVDRKNHLADDFADLYKRAEKQRLAVKPGWKPTRTPPIPGARKVKDQWVGAPQPPKPAPPPSPKDVSAALFTGWVDKARARYAAADIPGKKPSLSESNAWPRFVRVMEQGDRDDVDRLYAAHYLDDDLRDEAYRLIDEAEKVRTAAAADYAAAQDAYRAALKRWQRDVKDWRDANGVTSPTVAGMDGALRHRSNPDGVDWAEARWDPKKYTQEQRSALGDYTGSSYTVWNQHLRDTQGNPTEYGHVYNRIDAAMEAQPVPEDVVVTRGVARMYDLFEMPDGRRSRQGDDLTEIIGTKQVDWAYMSTAVGNTPPTAWRDADIQFRIRLPAGTPAAFVRSFSSYKEERELLLGRGLHYYVHRAERRSGKWVLEVEVVDQDFDPSTAVPSPTNDPFDL